MLPRILKRVVDWLRAHWQFSVELATHGYATWVYIRTWKSGEFVRVAVAIIDRYYDNPNTKLTILRKILWAIGSGASLIPSLVALTLWWPATRKITGVATRRPLWTTPSSVFGFQTMPSKNFIGELCNTRTLFNNRVPCYSLEGGVASRLDAIEAVSSIGHRNGRSVFLGLLDVVSNFIGVWPLIVSYIQETGKKDSGDGLVVWLLLLVSFFA